MTLSSHTSPIETLRAFYTTINSEFATSSSKEKLVYASFSSMTSRYKMVSEATTPSPISKADLSDRWQKILSFAGVWEVEQGIDENWLGEMRREAWGKRLDDLDDTTDDYRNP